MRPAIPACAAILAALPASAGEFEARVIGGSVQLGGALTVRVEADDGKLPQGARCSLELPAPLSDHVTVVSDDCARMELRQGIVPIRDDAGHAIPGASVPYTIRVAAPDGTALGEVTGEMPYHNQFTDLRLVIEGVRNPVAPGGSFTAVVLGAGQPIDDSLTCRWATYGPVAFEPAAENGCTGTVTALQPDGRDADMHVEIVNLADMHAVGYAIGRMLVAAD